MSSAFLIGRRCAIALLPLSVPSVAAIPGIELVDRTTIAAYIDSNGSSNGPVATSPDGRFVLFWSRASNLVVGDHNGNDDLFLHDANTGAIERVNVANDGSEAIGDTRDLRPHTRAGVSADGRYVTFQSRATNLVAESTGGIAQLYRRDRTNGTTTLISRGIDGMPATAYVVPGPSTPDGRYATIITRASNFPDHADASAPLYRIDTTTGSIVTVSVTTDGTPAVIGDRNLEISDDGRFVLFSSYSDSLVPGGAPNTEDFFLRDLQLGTTQQVSVTDTGAPAPAPPQLWPDELGLNRLSADGRYALLSTVTPLTAADTDVLHDIYRFDRLSGTTTLVSTDTGGTTPAAIHRSPSISGDGQHVLFQYFPGPGVPTQLVLRDMIAGTSTVLALPAMQTPTSVEQSLSRDASAVFFSGEQLPLASRILQVFRFDIATSTLFRLSKAPASSIGAYANGEVDRDTAPAVSADGRFVAFASVAENLVPGDTNGVSDVFVRDRLTETSQRISLRADGAESTCASVEPSLSSDGRFVTFTSCGALAPPASGTQSEIYRYDRVDGSLTLVSVASSGAQADSGSFESDVSDDGQYVALFSCARNLVAISGGNLCQHYLRDVAAGVTLLVSRSNSGEPATGNSFRASRLSANGRFAGYTSSASNLVAGDTNNSYDAFVFDRLTSTTERVSVSSSGQQGNQSSAFVDFAQGGNSVLLTSTATNFAAVGGSSVWRAYLRDRNAGTTTLIPTPGTPSISAVDPTISEDGRFVAMINRGLNSGLSAFDDARRSKLYVLDRHDGQFRTLTWFPRETTDTMTSLPQLSADGSHIAFISTRDDLTDDDGNGGMTDVFITRINDAIFSDGFQ